MGLFDRLKRSERVDLSKTPRYRMVSGETVPTTEQERVNREVMERQMTESRAKRDAEREG